MGGSLYPAVEPDREFRKEVFESERCQRIKDGVTSKLGELFSDFLAFIHFLMYLHAA